MNNLTVREKEILALISDGLTNKDIASKLGISVCTVQNHVQNIIKTLTVKNRIEAAKIYWAESLNPSIEEGLQ